MGRTVTDAMVTDVKLTDAAATVRDVRRLFEDPHVHAAVIVVDGLLLGVVEPADVEGALVSSSLALRLAQREGRVVTPDADLEEAWATMMATGRRRLAVADADGVFRGLLCLKRTRSGFCSDGDVRSRYRA